MRRQNVQTLSLVVCTFTYLLIGAAVFDALESETEAKGLEMIKEIRRGLQEKYNISDPEYKLIETVIIENQPHKAGPQWKFAGALYFVTVVVAMIGYGHSTPETVSGKAFCIVYAIVGIPLGMVMFQSIGERLNKFTSIIIKKIKTILGRESKDATDVDQLCVTGTLSTIVMTVGAAVFSHYEKWNYMDSFYYCFITLTTIGFGDYVALQKNNALTTKPGYVALSLVFILFGLTVVAASINLLVLRFMTLNTEDDNKLDYQMQDVSQSVVTLDGERMAINGKLLASAHEGIELSSHERVDSFTSITTVCSCTCYPRSHHSPADMRHRYSIVRSPSRISHTLLEPGGGGGLGKVAPHDNDEFPPLFHDSFMVANYLKTKRSSV